MCLAGLLFQDEDSLSTTSSSPHGSGSVTDSSIHSTGSRKVKERSSGVSVTESSDTNDDVVSNVESEGDMAGQQKGRKSEDSSAKSTSSDTYQVYYLLHVVFACSISLYLYMYL